MRRRGWSLQVLQELEIFPEAKGALETEGQQMTGVRFGIEIAETPTLRKPGGDRATVIRERVAQRTRI